MTLLDPVPPLVPATLGERAEQVLERLGDAPSLVFEGTWHTSGGLAQRARRAAGGFAGLGVGPGVDRRWAQLVLRPSEVASPS